MLIHSVWDGHHHFASCLSVIVGMLPICHVCTYVCFYLHMYVCIAMLWQGAIKEPDFFCLGNPFRDDPQRPPTGNCCPRPTVNHHQHPPDNCCQPQLTNNNPLPTTFYHQPPTIYCCHPPIDNHQFTNCLCLGTPWCWGMSRGEGGGGPRGLLLSPNFGFLNVQNSTFQNSQFDVGGVFFFTFELSFLNSC